MKYFFVLLAITFLASFCEISAQSWTQTGLGVPVADPAIGDGFGHSISIDGAVALIGATANSDFGSNQGKAVIFEKIAGVWTEKAKLYPGGDAPDMRFGTSVLIQGSYAFVGAPQFTYQGIYSGAVFVFENVSGTWSFDRRIDCPFPDDNVFFGTSIALSGNKLVIGAPGAYGSVAGAGAAFLFDFAGASVTFLDRINLPAGTASDKFGHSVAIDATNLFVGSPGRQAGAQTAAGSVFVYELINLTQVALLKMAVPVFAEFGYSLSLSGSQLAVSAPFTANANTSFGGVYMFLKPGAEWADATEDFSLIPTVNIPDYGLYGRQLSLIGDYLLVGGSSGVRVDLIKKGAGGWGSATVVKTFHESGLVYQNQYGAAVAMSPTDVLVGAYNLNQPGVAGGAVFAYEKSGPEWDMPLTLPMLTAPSLNASYDEFGRAVDIIGNYAVVGASKDDSFLSNSGAAYVFQFDGTTWQRVAKLTPTTGYADGYFGYSVSITNDRVVVSASGAQVSGTTAGIVYVFEKPALGWSDMHETTSIARVNLTKPGDFGYEVDAAGNEIVVSHYKPGGTSSYGQVYVFEKSGANWSLKTILNPPALNDSQADGFGSALTYDGAQLVVGVPYGGASVRAGQVYVFEKPIAGWSAILPTATLTPSDPINFGGFGWRVGVFENAIIVREKRAAYVFEKSGSHWLDATEDARLSQSNTDPSNVTQDVAIGRNNAVLTTTISGIGVVLLYKKVNHEWKNTSEYDSFSGPAAPSEMGDAAALSQDHLIVADPVSNSTSGGSTGIVKFYVKQPTVLSVSSSTADGTYAAGQHINVNVQYSHAITLTGDPTMELVMHDNTVRTAALDGAVVNGVINFKYTVAVNDSTRDLNYKDEFSMKGTFTVNSSIVPLVQGIKELPLANAPYALGALKNIVIDAISNPEPELEDPVLAVEGENIQVSFYPIPSSSQLILAGDGIQTYEMRTVTGAVVIKEADFIQRPLDISHLAPGLYLLHVRTAKGSVIKKIIKQ